MATSEEPLPLALLSFFDVPNITTASHSTDSHSTDSHSQDSMHSNGSMPSMDSMMNGQPQEPMPSMPHMHNPGMMAEHMDFLQLVPTDRATHIAVNNGSWFDPNTWQNGQVPGDNAEVLIGEGVQVSYDDGSDVRLKTLRVDGRLSFATNQDTKLIVDTFINAPSGELVIGTEGNPVQAGVKTEIIFTSEGAIDRSWDPKLLSRGIVSHGKVSIHGADKDDFLTLQQDAMAGDRELVLSQVPTGWQIGDKLVLGGTDHKWGKSDDTNDRFQDEELIITGINGNRVTFTNANISEGDNQVLRFDHQRPEGFEDRLNLYVANTSRNITFETENAGAIANSRRAHVMFMHNPDVVVKNAGFYNLGRSDKSQLVDDVGENKDGRAGGGTNPRGRYALHFHRTGAESWDGQAAIAQGNAVVGSPGWGIVHHDSHAILEDNVVFDVVGAGIVAEAGNEIGAWRNNLTIKTTGDDDHDLDLGFRNTRVENFDFGFNGEGYWVQGAAQIEITDNAAVSAAGGGLNIFGGGDGGESVRDKKKIAVANLPEQYRDIAQGTDDEAMIEVSAVPVLKVQGFEAYNALEGLSSWTRLRNSDGQLGLQFDSEGETRPAHDYRSTIEDFKVWNIYGTGVRLQYSGSVDLKEGLVLGKDAYGTGIHTNHAATKQRFSNLQVEGFKQGMRVPLDASVEFVGSILENSILRNNDVNFEVTPDFKNQQTGEQPKDFSAFFQIRDGNEFEIPMDNVAPTPDFLAIGAGGLAVTLDAGASLDGDSELNGQQASNGIVSYGWDLDDDGVIDRYGRQIRQIFDSPGTYNIGLTVWDDQGAKQSTTQTIDVASTPFDNPFVDGSFSDPTARLEGWQSDSSYSDRGWFTTGDEVSTDGTLRLHRLGNWGGGAGQIIRDEKIRKGNQTLSFDFKNTEGDTRPWLLNQVKVRFWGVNGQFENQLWEESGPTAAGTLPMQSTVLLDTQLGGETVDWQNLTWDLDLGDGYDYLFFQVNTAATGNDGDYVALDNLSLMGEGGSVLGDSNGLSPAAPPVLESDLESESEPEPEPEAIPSEPEPVVEPGMKGYGDKPGLEHTAELEAIESEPESSQPEPDHPDSTELELFSIPEDVEEAILEFVNEVNDLPDEASDQPLTGDENIDAQAAEDLPSSPDLDASESDVTGPDVTGPDVAEPEVFEFDSAEIDASEDASESDVLESDVSESVVSESSTARTEQQAAALINNLIDLRQIDLNNDGQVDEQVEITLANIESSAGYNNSIGFYEIADESGAIIDQMTGQLILPENESYAEVALRQHLSGVEVLRDSGEMSFGAKGGGLLGAFLVADGAIADMMAQNPTNQANGSMHAYFAVQGANPDRVSHVQGLGNGRLGFEDLWGGGDNDFNDFIFNAEVGMMA